MGPTPSPGRGSVRRTSRHGPRDPDLARDLSGFVNDELFKSRAPRAFFVSRRDSEFRVVAEFSKKQIDLDRHLQALDERREEVDVIVHLVKHTDIPCAYACVLEQDEALYRLRLRENPPPPRAIWAPLLRRSREFWQQTWKE